MPRAVSAERDTSIRTYKARRDFAATPEPAPATAPHPSSAAIFVVQKHAARRLHWDFRLEYGGVLWSWAVPKGPSRDPADKRLAVRTEDHPLDYADFQGTIPAGQYGAGTVETWDRGTWAPQFEGDPQGALDRGELKFTLDGARLRGKFVLIRLKPRPNERSENWLLIKEHDPFEAPGADAARMEAETPFPAPAEAKPPAAPNSPPAQRRATKRRGGSPVPGAVRAGDQADPRPQLASLADDLPEGSDWLSEVKFDGYRLLAVKTGDAVRLLTRSGLDWTARLPTVARAVASLGVPSAILDGELLALREDGVSSFALLQQALSDGVDGQLFLYVFDLLFLDGWDCRPAKLIDRKAALHGLSDWKGALRFSDHVEGEADAMRRHACALGLEGIVCKQKAAPYKAGRGRSWLKVKCLGREEFIVLGFTPPAGQRTGLGALHLGYRTPEGGLEYAGGVGTGFTERELAALRRRLDGLAADAPPGLRYAGEKPDRTIAWVKPELVAEVQFVGWSGSGRIRHATYLGLREDKPAAEITRPAADPAAVRVTLPRRVSGSVVRAVSPPRLSSRGKPKPGRAAPATAAAVSGRAIAARGADVLEGVRLTHGERELWPGISKRQLAEYWQAVAPAALGEIGGRPLALVRCPEGIEGERFFQKRAKKGFPAGIRTAEADGAPYLALDGLPGLIACAQVSAIELHAWGATERDALHPDRLVFDLDPGESVSFGDVVTAAYDVRERLGAAGLESFCRTTGGKGLHVVAPLRPRADWTETRAWCRAFAERMVAEQPERYVSRLAKVERRGHILVDWLRNGLGSTAVASFSPRARPGATVATPLAWSEVTATLDPQLFTVETVPARLRKQKADPWRGFDTLDQTFAATDTPRRPVKRKR
ncbi:MAG: DNA ligase D [Acetobacteraceae bacterium]|nr:DNA ligase D [Acetobacteraceae bacterium]